MTPQAVFRTGYLGRNRRAGKDGLLFINRPAGLLASGCATGFGGAVPWWQGVRRPLRHATREGGAQDRYLLWRARVVPRSASVAALVHPGRVRTAQMPRWLEAAGPGCSRRSKIGTYLPR